MRLEYENIHVRLGKKEILHGVSLHTEEGQMTGIIGPNGCGKSTLLKTALGLCRPHTGRILADSQDIRRMSPKMRAALIGYVGQDSACAFDFTVSEIARMGLYSRQDKSQPAKRIIEQALEDLKIAHLSERSILSLSGGEKKMAFLARAVVQGADTLILDEPTNHLDIRHQLFLLDYLKKSGRTVLIVLHDLRLAAHYCDRLYLLSEGTLAAQGAPDTVLSREHVLRAFQIHGQICRTENGGRDFSLFPDA